MGGREKRTFHRAPINGASLKRVVERRVRILPHETFLPLPPFSEQPSSAFIIRVAGISGCHCRPWNLWTAMQKRANRCVYNLLTRKSTSEFMTLLGAASSAGFYISSCGEERIRVIREYFSALTNENLSSLSIIKEWKLLSLGKLKLPPPPSPQSDNTIAAARSGRRYTNKSARSINPSASPWTNVLSLKLR